MIDLKELKHRDYNGGKQCVGFQYTLDLGQDDPPMFFRFIRGDQLHGANQGDGNAQKVWQMETAIGGQHYYITFEIPRVDIPLTLICAIGLRYFKMQMQSEVQYRVNIDFTIGNVTEDM